MTQLARTPQSAINTMVRDNIYKAVINVLSEQGVKAFTMERVAEEAGIAKGSIYNHFKNKEDLLRFVYRQTVDPVKQQAELAMQQAPSCAGKLWALIETWFCGIIDNRVMFEFLIHDRSINRMLDRVPDRARDICIDQAHQVFHEGIDKGEFRSDFSALLLAEILFGATSDVVTYKVARGEKVDLQGVIKAINEVFLNGVLAEK
ncbi:MAG: TetR/AcrR family transcriptional regulator [Planctomycetia bacterium]|jgi:AcrR family transcriptional regulator